MPYDEAEADDPMVLVAVPAPDDPAMVREMALCIADEYARMGMGREEVMRLFTDPFFAMTHGIYRSQGDAFVRAVVDEAYARWTRPSAAPEPDPAARRAGACPPPTDD